MSRTYHRRFRVIRTFCSVSVLVLCSLFFVAAPSAHAQKKVTVAGELKRLQAEGADPAAIAAYRATYDDARARVKRLTGARKVQLGGVVTDLEGMAARKQFTLSRLPSLFLTLQRNIEWWTTQRLLNSGERVGFTGSELVFQFYPGHGIQIQWLGTFGKLNGYWSGGKRYDARASALLDEIKTLSAQRAGGLAWEYLFPFDGQQPPWVSSLAQGTGLQAMARSATRLKRQEDVFPVALAGLGIFKAAPPTGVRIPSGTGAHYLQYSGLPKLQGGQRLHPVAQRPLRLRHPHRRPHRAVPVRGRRPRRPRRDRHVRHRAPGASTAAAHRSRASPTSATTSS